MVTKLQALTEAKRLLGEENIPDWQLSAEYILAVALKCEHSDLYKIESLTDRQFKKYLKLIGQRCRHVPLDKIIGYTEFFSLKIPYNHNVLTPRNETELLADRLIKDIKDAYKKNKFASNLNLLDLCTGSGCLGLSVAHNTNVNVTLSDISKQAIKIAKFNNKCNN
jgi:release factor glutamine methyltransferase